MKRVAVSLCLPVAACLLLSQTPRLTNSGWTTYHGQYGGNRFSTLDIINNTNVVGLKTIRSFPVNPAFNVSGLEGTPLVSGSTMYFTSTNSVYAYNLASGQLVWSFNRSPTPGLVANAAQGYNRGVALSADSVFLETDNAHLISFNAASGALQWETTIADYTQNYGSTSAPLYLPSLNLVVVGVSGGDAGVRGLLAAYHADNSASNNNQSPVWQFYTTPASLSDPLAATWGTGGVLPHGCGAPWTTGTFDTTANVLYWGIGNPCRDFNGDDRQGANLYTSSVVALSPSTGQLIWYFQFTPHGLWDYDGANVPMLINANWQGSPRNLMMHADRNGFFYLLDRGTGQYLQAFPFVSNLTWASGIDASGTPAVNPEAIPSTSGALSCPGAAGATNWMASAFSPVTSLFYVHALEYCNVFIKGQLWQWQAGQPFQGGETQPPPGMTAQSYLYAFNPLTQSACAQTPCPPSLAWSYPLPGLAGSVGGVLATAGGLVFSAAAKQLTALDASTGQVLWSHGAGSQGLKSSPMTYEFNGKQYVALATSDSIIVYGL